jgi:uncharacterized SAM-binding protein YcdF (DUF218 family)
MEHRKINLKSPPMNYRNLSTPAFISCALTMLCSYDHPHTKSHGQEPQKKPMKYDVIIVPGVPYQEPSMKIILKARILWAKYLYDRKIAENIIFSGSSVYTPYVEGKVMRIYADSLGIPPAHTFSETQAEHSTENIYYSVLMARKLGFKNIAVATDQYQAVILNRFIKKNCPEVKILPIDYNKIDLIMSAWPSIDASSAYVDNFVSLPEREDRSERFQGTLGKKISFSSNDSTYENSRTPRIAGVQRMLTPLITSSPFLSVIYNPD